MKEEDYDELTEILRTVVEEIWEVVKKRKEFFSENPALINAKQKNHVNLSAMSELTGINRLKLGRAYDGLTVLNVKEYKKIRHWCIKCGLPYTLSHLLKDEGDIPLSFEHKSAIDDVKEEYKRYRDAMERILKNMDLNR